MKLFGVFIYIFFIVFNPIASGASIPHYIYSDNSKRDYDYNQIKDEDISHCRDEKCFYLSSLYIIREKNIEQGIKNLRTLADDKLLDAQLSMFKIYLWKKNSQITDHEALSYLISSAKDGYTPSQVELSFQYARGEIIEKNISLYHFWMESAAKDGDPIAMIYTSGDYYLGRGTNKQDDKGFYWLQRAKEKLGRDFNEWGRLGYVYEYGAGTAIDLAKAYMCYDLEGTAGIEEKARIAPKMTAEQRAEGLRLSHEWQEKNHVYTMQSLGLSRQKDGSYR